MYWNNMYLFRKDRERNKRYCYGDQWKDRIKVDGEWMTEEEYIKQQGTISPKAHNNWRFIPAEIVEPAKKRDYRQLFGADSQPQSAK